MNKASHKQLHLLILSHISELSGGAERSMMDLMDYWSANYNVKLEFILRQPLKSLAGELDKRRWKYHSLNYTFWSDGNPPTKKEDIFRNSVANSRAIEDIEKIIKSSKPDIVLTNTIISPWAAMAAHYQQVPHVWFVREYGGHDHGRTFEIGEEATFKDIGNLSNLVVANSKTLADYISQYIDKSKMTVLYNPFDLGKIARMAAEKVRSPYKSSDSLKLVITSRVAPSKGQLEAVIATGILNQEGYDTELAIVGEADNEAFNRKLNEEMKRYGIEDKVHMVGFKKNALAYVGLADVGIVPSRREAFGRLTFEFIALGKPVAGANSGATPEMVKDSQNGYLFEAGDARGLAAAVRHYAKNRSLLTSHGKKSREIARTMLQSKSNADTLYSKLSAIAGGKVQPKATPINLTHRWLDYQQIADEFIKESGQVSLKRLVKLRARQRAKGAYYRVRSAKAKLTGN